MSPRASASSPTPDDDRDDGARDDDDRRRSASCATASTQSAWRGRLGGVEIRCPLVPYKSQMQVMSQVVRAASKRACALIESPTGSGKSLALLCAALAWREREIEEREEARERGRGGEKEDKGEARGETGESDAEGREDDDDDDDGEKTRATVTSKAQGGRKRASTRAPKIYYATRTHSQIAQIVSELARTSYKPQSVVLGSREHYCVNKSVNKSGNVNEECKRLMDVSAGGDGRGCFYAGQAASKLASIAKNHPDPLDIEDLMKMGVKKRGCPYFASKMMAESADIVFCPYNYLLDPRTRKAMDIDIEDSLIIFDEAHNIEDIAREAASEEFNLDDVANAVDQLRDMSRRLTVHKSECDLVAQTMNNLYEWFLQLCVSLQKTSLDAWSTMIRGETTLQVLSNAGLTEASVLGVMKALDEITKFNLEHKDPKERVSNGVFNTCEKVLIPIKFLLSRGDRTGRDYRIFLTKTLDDDKVATTQRTKSTLPVNEIVRLNFSALNPALAFSELTGENGARSVVLSSGTLAPLNSFASELGNDFPIRMEAQHCIDMQKQVWGGLIAAGPRDVPLNAGFKSRGDHAFQDELGASLQQWAQTVPHGMLMFFPSYSLMDSIVRRWRETGLWRAIEQSSGKKIFQEPNKKNSYGKKPPTLENVLDKYYAAVSTSVNAAKHPYAPAPKTARCRGAILLAVCRGKISEGINFADANARAVICVGIPYPNIKDPLVAEKRSYNDAGRHRGLMSGSKWYDQQAWRALNQCVGRMLRHRYDHGAIMLVDQRFTQQHLQSLPKWLRPAMQRAPARFDAHLESLQSFFEHHAENPPKQEEPASCAENSKSGKRRRTSITAVSPRKSMRNTPITNFFQKATSTNATTGDDPLMRNIDKPNADRARPPVDAYKAPMLAEDDYFDDLDVRKRTHVPQKPRDTPDETIDGTYQAPMLTDDDDFDVDLAALVDADEHDQGSDDREDAKKESPAEEELSTEAMCAQIMDGIEWDDEDDEDQWWHQAIECTQTAQTLSKVESTTPTLEMSAPEVTSPKPGLRA